MQTRASNSLSKKKELIVSGPAKRARRSTATREFPRVTLLATLEKASTAKLSSNRQNPVTDCREAPVMPQIQTV